HGFGRQWPGLRRKRRRQQGADDGAQKKRVHGLSSGSETGRAKAPTLRRQEARHSKAAARSCVDQARGCRGGRWGPSGMKPARMAEGDTGTAFEPPKEGRDCGEEGGATAPAQKEEQALHEECG